MKDILFGIGIFFGTLIIGFLMRGIWNGIRKPTHNESRLKGELCAVTVFHYRIGRYSPGGNLYEYHFEKKKNRWRYRVDKLAAGIGLATYIVMVIIIGIVCLRAENGYLFFIHVVPYLGCMFLAGALVGPLSAYRYVLRLERKSRGRKK